MKKRVLKIQKFRKMLNPQGHLFGYVRRDKFGRKKLHQGVDFACEVDTPIFAPDDCKIVKNGYSKSYGYYSLFECYNNFKNQQILYYLFLAHITKKPTRLETPFLKGSVIAHSSDSGNARGMNTIAKGSHLHLEIRIKKNCGTGADGRKNPLDYGFLELD